MTTKPIQPRVWKFVRSTMAKPAWLINCSNSREG